MDGRGRFMDNIFIERLWRSLKYEAVYLHELEDGHHARQVGLDRILQPRETPFFPAWAHARERVPRSRVLGGSQSSRFAASTSFRPFG